MDVFYMVYVEGASTPSVKHVEYQAALSEARRLAIVTGRQTYVLAAMNVIKVLTEVEVLEKPEAAHD